MKRRWPLLAVNLLLLAAVLVFLFWQSEEDRVRAALRDLRDVVAKSGLEHELAFAGRRGRLAELITEDCRVALQAPAPRDLAGRQAVADTFAMLWRRMGAVEIDLGPVELDLDEEAGTARTRVAAGVRYRLGGEWRDETRRLTVRWRRGEDGEWRAASILQKEAAASAP
jgi:ketosteroid isomerase-like protein